MRLLLGFPCFVIILFIPNNLIKANFRFKFTESCSFSTLFLTCFLFDAFLSFNLNKWKALKI